MKKLISIVMLLAAGIYAATAQDTARFKPSGKVESLIFTNVNNATSGGKNATRFEVTRAYFGYSYNFSPTLSGRIIFDVSNPGAGNLQLTAFLKNGYLQYLKNNFTLKFGLIPTIAFDVQEKFWGYRYVIKSFQDQYGMNPSADFGISAQYKFSDLVTADLMIENGEGFRTLDTDSVLKSGVGITLRPLKSLTLRGYYDYANKHGAEQQTIGAMAGYANKTFSLGAEYNFQSDNKLVNGNNFSGYSAYGTYYLSSRSDLFARYDYLTSVTPSSTATAWNYANDGQLFLAGFEYIPVKGLKIAPNYQLWKPRSVLKSNISSIFLNIEIRM